MRVLIVDDDAGIRWLLARVLQEEGHSVLEADTLQAGVAQQEQAELVFLDVFLPDGNGMEALHSGLFCSPVIILTAETTFDHAAEAYQYGAMEYLPKPFDLLEVRQLLQRAEIASTADQPAAQPLPSQPRSLMIGRSPAMQQLFRTLGKVAASSLGVLIHGESGTGKDLVARELHARSPRAKQAFIAINTAAIPAELLEAELFGHDKGAFTGADKAREGRFVQADGGTLFLDEIGDMPLALQSKLLRVLESGLIQAVGSTREIKVDIRLVAATHQDLRKKIRDGTFREDLYYRLNVIPLTVPPLREREGDIAELAEYFLQQAVREHGCPQRILQPDALAQLSRYRWPGNVRELKNVMQRLAILSTGLTIGANDVVLATGAQEAQADDHSNSFDDLVEQWLEDYCNRVTDAQHCDLYQRMKACFEPPLLRYVLRQTHGHQLRAAAMLGINRNTLRKLLRQYAIDPADFSGR